jgi:hypothetical protein
LNNLKRAEVVAVIAVVVVVLVVVIVGSNEKDTTCEEKSVGVI